MFLDSFETSCLQVFLILVMHGTAEEALETFSKHPAYMRVSPVCLNVSVVPACFQWVIRAFLPVSIFVIWADGKRVNAHWFFYPCGLGAGFYRESSPHQFRAVISRLLGRSCDQIITSVNASRWRGTSSFIYEGYPLENTRL